MKKVLLNILTIAFLCSAGNGYSQSTTPPQVSLDKVLTTASSSPWGMAFINNDELLFTEIDGKLWRYKISTNTKQAVTGLPTIARNEQGGLLDIALHPDFNSNNYVYLTYAVAGSGGQTTALGRGVLNNNQLQNFTEIFRALPLVANSGLHFGSRIAFDRGKFLFISVGERNIGENAQNRNNHLGKIMRLKDDGSIPADNPFVDVPNTKPEIWSYGHRNIQGMAIHPVTGQLYAHEHGPQGGDELNIIKKGANYGWPVISYGVPYGSSDAPAKTSAPGMEQPLTYWVPSIAPSGMVFIQNGQPSNEADILIGALGWGENTPGQHIHWLRMVDDKKTLSTMSMKGAGRFRDVEQAPDGKLYALTQSPNQLILLKSNQTLTSSIEENTVAETADVLFPNPSNDGATIKISLDKAEKVTVRIYTSEGALAQTAFMQEYSVGSHSINLNADGLAKGMYQVEITKGNKKSVLKWVKM